MTNGNSFFVDANVLVYAALQDDPRHHAAKALIEDPNGSPVYISAQIVAEFFSTITNPKRVSAPYTPADAIEFLQLLLAFDHVSVLPISAEVPARLFALLKDHEVRGPRVFDVQIVATMLAAGVTKICTYNGSDFAQFDELDVFEP